MRRESSILTTCLILALCLAGAASAAQINAYVDAASVRWDAAPGYQLTLTISGPDGFYYRSELAPGETPEFGVFTDGGDYLADGAYSWELTASPVKGAKRGAEALAVATGFNSSGSFSVAGGAFVDTLLPEAGADKDQVIVDDLIVDGSACIGIDCVNGENFGFDTLRLKENNLRIKFQDTSSSGSFPSNDWQITANDSSNGGKNKFSIDDIDGGRTPFTIEAGAPSNSLYVDSGGDVGFGTSTPVVNLHVKDGNTPTLRLEQDGSSGFTPQTWDVAGNETNFFIRDATNGSDLPLRIFPGAGDDVLNLKSGRVGINTVNPDDELEVKSAAANESVVRVEASNSTNRLVVLSETSNNAGLIGLFDGADNQAIRFTGDFQGRLSIGCSSSPADITLNSAGSGACGSGTESTINAGDTTFTITSSRTIKENIAPVAVPDILDRISGIDVYTYDYIDGPADKLGLIAEDFHQVFGRGSDKVINGQEVEMALWLAVRELTAQNRELQERLAEVEEKLPAE